MARSLCVIRSPWFKSMPTSCVRTRADQQSNGYFIMNTISSTKVLSWQKQHSSNHNWSGDVAKVVRASDRHAADAGSISRCEQEIFLPEPFFQSKLSYGVREPPCAIACINICVRVQDPVVHVRVRWIMETLKHPARNATLSQMAFPGAAQQTTEKTRQC